jgi:HlyD family secretion protein
MTAADLAAGRDRRRADGAAPGLRSVIDYDFASMLAAPPRQRIVLWLMLTVVIVGTIGLAVAPVDIVISANGKIITSDSQIVLQPLEASVVRALNVKPGDKVKKGAVLARLDPTFSKADEAELTTKFRHLAAVCERLAAEAAGRPYEPAAPNAEQLIERQIYHQRQAEYLAKMTALERKTAQYRADLAAHKTEAAGLAQQINLVGEQEQMYSALVQQNLASKLKLLDARQRLVDAKSRLDTNSGEQKRLQEQIAETLAERDAAGEEWRRKVSEDLAQNRSDRDATAARLTKAKLRRELSVLRAPTDATVLEIADRPAGSVVREAETLVRLVPAGAPLIAEVNIDPRDVARMQVGDRVTLKLEALPWQQFGLAYGIVRSISPDVLDDGNPRETAAANSAPGLKREIHPSPIHYRARIEVTETHFRNMPVDFMLRPGMRLVGDIKLGRRSVLQYVMNPLTRVIGESFREP